jgi:hypothetical protein
MSRNLVRVLVLCAALSFAAQAAWAGPARAGESSGSAWGLLVQLWSSFTESWPDSGCWLDPGGCAAAQASAPPPEPEVGCWIDPNGGCGDAQAPAPPPLTDVGCIIDPYGGCRAGG